MTSPRPGRDIEQVHQKQLGIDITSNVGGENGVRLPLSSEINRRHHAADHRCILNFFCAESAILHITLMRWSFATDEEGFG
jgi:hypothetical protein